MHLVQRRIAAHSSVDLVTRHDRLSAASVVMLQMAYASEGGNPRWDPNVMENLGFPFDAEDLAIEELQASGLLEPGEVEEELRLTGNGWMCANDLWPTGQLPGHGGGLVIGSFDGQDEMPVRLATPVVDITEVFPDNARFVREAKAQDLTYSAWRLHWPPTGETGSRILVRIDEGEGYVVESHGSPDAGMKISVGPQTWLSVDLKGRCRESRQSLQEIVFLIGMGAA